MPIEPIYNEEDLLKKMAEGDEKAFTKLYMQYGPVIYSALLKMVRDPFIAEEMVQEIFTKIWAKKEALDIKENFGGYVYRAARNHVLNFYDRLKLERQTLERFKLLIQDNYQHIEDMLLDKENAAYLEQALASLTPQQRKVYSLCKIEGLSYQQAASLLNLSAATVNEHLVNANKGLRAFFKDNSGHALGILFMSFLLAP